MREARALEEYNQQRAAAKRAKRSPAKSGLFSFFGSKNAKQRHPRRPATLTRGSQSSRTSARGPGDKHSSLSRRPTGHSSRHPSYNSGRNVARMKSYKK